MFCAFVNEKKDVDEGAKESIDGRIAWGRLVRGDLGSGLPAEGRNGNLKAFNYKIHS